jgi:hypothetical protein
MADTPIVAYAKVVKKALADPAFKAELLGSPNAALAAAGVPIPPGVTVKVLEDTDKIVHLVLPAVPNGELADEHLDLVAGGVTNLSHAVVTAGVVA